jgi:phytoene dehydrogenase-like protein
VVVGAGPNGLTAAAVLARAGASVLVLEGADTIGGGTRTLELTLPGFLHDHCSATHPLGAASPVFRDLRLEEDHGLEWLQGDIATAHPLDDGSAAVIHRSLDATCEAMGVDAQAWNRLIGWAVRHWDVIGRAALTPIVRPPVRHPLLFAKLGYLSTLPASVLAKRAFAGEHARAAFAGFGAHAVVPFEKPLTGAGGLVFNASAHTVGMPVAKGGSRAITDALASALRAHGGEIVTGHPVRSMADVPSAGAVLFDLIPRQILEIAGDRVAGRVRRGFRRFRPGNAAFKLDYALSEVVPWKNDACRATGNVHLGGTFDEIALSEREVGQGRPPDRPYMLVGQQSLLDPSRAPEGKHTLWAYCHVPRGCDVDMTERMEAQLERFAPGFRDVVLARHVMFPADFERDNPSMAGGDFAGGSAAGLQMLFRPRIALDPYTVGEGLYICSQSAPPAPGVHGMCGYWAARKALEDLKDLVAD